MGAHLTVTAKGQVTLRKDVLEHLGAAPGDKLELDLLPDGQILIRPKARQPISHLFGLLAGEETKSVSVEEMNEVIADGWAGKS